MPRNDLQLHATIDAETKSVIDELAKDLRMSRSELVRESIATVYALRRQREMGRDIVVAEGNIVLTDLHFLPALKLATK